MARDIGFPKIKISRHQQINAWRGIINATKARKKKSLLSPRDLRKYLATMIPETFANKWFMSP